MHAWLRPRLLLRGLRVAGCARPCLVLFLSCFCLVYVWSCFCLVVLSCFERGHARAAFATAQPRTHAYTPVRTPGRPHAHLGPHRRRLAFYCVGCAWKGPQSLMQPSSHARASPRSAKVSPPIARITCPITLPISGIYLVHHPTFALHPPSARHLPRLLLRPLSLRSRARPLHRHLDRIVHARCAHAAVS